MRGVYTVTVCFKCRSCGAKPRGPAQVARRVRLRPRQRHASRGRRPLGPNARAAFRRSSFARTKSPSCAIAMRRNARAVVHAGRPASGRRVDRLLRVREPASVIRESPHNPAHLDLCWTAYLLDNAGLTVLSEKPVSYAAGADPDLAITEHRSLIPDKQIIESLPGGNISHRRTHHDVLDRRDLPVSD